MRMRMLIVFLNEAGRLRAFASFYAHRSARGWLAVPGFATEAECGAEGEPLRPFVSSGLRDPTRHPVEVSTEQQFGRSTIVLKWLVEESPLFLRIEEDGSLLEFRDPMRCSDRPQIRVRFCADGTARVVPIFRPNVMSQSSVT